MTLSARETFQSLLRELFQFDCADLDFGIYRIMNHKRAVIERFITQDLPKAIAEELRQGALAEQGQAQGTLQAARQKVLDALGEDALDADGNLAETYHNTKAGKEYLEAQAKAQGARSTEALEAAIYNHLYTFFSRYWQDGDFISKRRYSKKERYAIPYNGEEVYLYWANHDQYYVKTGEYFTDYSYKAPNGVTVHFKLQQADVEQNNVKGEKRFFLPILDGIAWDQKARTLTIPFEFRPLTAQETIAYGQKNQQEAIIAKAMTEIPKRVKAPDALAALTAERRKTEKDETVTWLEHHLRQYTRRNTSDFFIHKDLRGFLARELDFYLKNEVLNLEEMEAAGEGLAEGWFQLMRLIKRVGGHIIDFLAQIEDFQKMLWEKKKFVTETFYVVTVGSIPEAFYPEIAACEAQWEEWESTLHIDEEQANLFTAGKGKKDKRIEFLKAHPTLPLDTRHFPQDFVDRLLASFDPSTGSGQGLDGMTDGLLVHAENWQALNLLQEKYRERVKCIYIDPPYNTGSDEFLYRDAYQHSSWLAMMENRMVKSTPIMLADSAIFISIGNDECSNLRMLIEETLGNDNFRSTVIYRRGIKSVQAQFDTVDKLNQGYDFLLMASKNDKTRFPKLMVPKSVEDGYDSETTEPVGSWNNHWRGTDRPSMRYPLFGITPSSGQWRWGRERSEKAIENYKRMCLELGTEHPTQQQIDEWVKEKDGGGEYLDLLRLSASGTPEHYVRPSSEKLSSDLWIDLKPNGSRQLEALFGKKIFENPKATNLIERIVKFVCDEASFILDYFAGSGTTGHAVIALNREDGGRRKFILVEMAHYFDTVLLPRIKKVTFTPEWKDGKPKRMATAEEAARSPRLVKVIRLESYEDALNNLTFDDEGGAKALDLFKDDYLLHYMLRWETRKSATLLDVERLQTPFAYKLRLHRDGETRERLVDLPETFAYLLGLDVQTRRVYLTQRHKGAEQNLGGSVSPCDRYLVYRGTLRNGRTVAVIWRETKGWTEEDYKRDRAFVAAQKLAEGAEEIFVNGDSLIPGAQSLDPVFKERMFAKVEG